MAISLLFILSLPARAQKRAVKGAISGTVDSVQGTLVRLGAGAIRLDVAGAQIESLTRTGLPHSVISPGMHIEAFIKRIPLDRAAPLSVSLVRLVLSDEARITHAVEAVDARTRTIVMLKEPIAVASSATIVDRYNQPVRLDQIGAGSSVSASVRATGGGLVATRLLVQPPRRDSSLIIDAATVTAVSGARVELLGGRLILDLTAARIYSQDDGRPHSLADIRVDTRLQFALTDGAASFGNVLTPEIFQVTTPHYGEIGSALIQQVDKGARTVTVLNQVIVMATVNKIKMGREALLVTFKIVGNRLLSIRLVMAESGASVLSTPAKGCFY